MEWIQRNPKKAVALSALAVLVVVIIVWGASSRSDTPAAEPTLGLPSPALPTTTPTRKLTALPTPSASPTSVGDAIAGFPSSGMGIAAAGGAGTGFSNGLPRHRVVISAGSDGPLGGVGWRVPTADGDRVGRDTAPGSSFSHTSTAYGPPDYAQLYTYVGPESSKVWCTVTVDGKVTDHQEAKGPWGQVFCQG